MKAIIFSLALLISHPASANNFWWGISTSPYQTEDPAIKPSDPLFFQTDWDLFYAAGKLKELRGNGVYSYSMVDRDISTLKSLGVTHYRFGIEWARVEPKPGVYNEVAIQHYLTLVRKLKKAGITPVVCLWHFTFPSWTVSQNLENNGWVNAELQKRWAQYVKLVATRFGSEVYLYAPQNEPNAQALAAYFLGRFPPGAKYKLSLYRQQISAAAKAFNEAAEIIKQQNPDAKIISVQNVVYWTKAWWDLFGYFWKIGQEYNHAHLEATLHNLDYVGINYYYEHEASPLASQIIVNPSGLTNLLEEFSKRYQKPLLITENGIGTEDDEKRVQFVGAHIKAAQAAAQKGVDLRGYFFWSLVDNYEWADGYKEKFGLYRMRKDRSLEPKKSALVFKSFIEARETRGP